jgi:hypothetical protein
MARKLRLQYPGAIYHAMNRGDRREPIFNDDEDRRMFLDTPRNHHDAGMDRQPLCMGGPMHVATLLQRYRRKEERSENTLF